MAQLRNIDLTDRELLHLIDDVAADGPVTANDVGIALGMSANGKSVAQRVSTRLSWMVRYGFLERIDPRESDTGKVSDPVRWIITDAGRLIMAGKLTKALEQQLESMQPGSQVLLMRKLTQRAYVEARAEIATAVRREYLHQAAKRMM